MFLKFLFSSRSSFDLLLLLFRSGKGKVKKNGSALNGEIQNIDSKSEITRQADDMEKEQSHHEAVEKSEEPNEVGKSEQKESECDFDEGNLNNINQYIHLLKSFQLMIILIHNQY